MKVTTERLDNCQVRVTVELDAAETEAKLRQTAQQVSRKYTIPGYRKGKAPYAAVVRSFGRELLQQQALDDFGQELYDQALGEVDYEPYGMGELEKVEWEPFRMHILLPIRPEVDLGDYRSVRLTHETKPVTDEDVDRYLEDVRQEHAQWVPVERPAAMGDQVVVDIEGKVDGETVLGNQGRELILSADARYPLPGFHEQIVGMSPGEEKTFTLTYPEDEPRKELAGKEGVFTVKLVAVNKQDVPPLDDDLALMVGDYESLADLRTAVRADLEKEAEERVNAEFPEEVLTAMIDQAVKIEFPPQAVDKELDEMLEQMENSLSGRGLKLDTYLGMMGKTRAAYRDELRPMALNRLKRTLALGEIIKREGLTVEGEDVQAEMDRLAASEEFQEEEMQQVLQTPGARITVMNDLLITRARQRLSAIAKGEAPDLPAPAAEGEETSESQIIAEGLAEMEAVQADTAEREAAAEQSPEPEPTEAAQPAPAVAADEE
jgi:trigger factor